MMGFEHEQQVQALADAYRAAALQESDMTAVTDALEALRQGWAQATEDADEWREADDAIGRTDDGKLTGVLLQVRTRLAHSVTEASMRAVADAFALGDAAGRAALRKAWADAFIRGRYALAESLARADYPAVAPDDGERRQLLDLIRLARVEAWQLAAPAMRALVADDRLAPREASSLHVMLGQIALFLDGDAPEALHHFRLALDLQPKSSFATVGIGQYWQEQKDFARARHYYDEAMSLDPRNGFACSAMGDCLDKEGKAELAQVWHEEGLRREPSNADCAKGLLRLWGCCAIEGEHPELPDRLAEQMARANPDAPNSIFREASAAYYAREDFAAALAWIERAIEADPGHPTNYVFLATVLEAQQRHEEALDAAERAIAALPESAEGYEMLGYLAEARQLWARAEQAYRGAAERKPSSATSYNAKAAEMAWHDGRRTDGTKELFALLRQAPQDETVLGTMERLANALQDGGGRPAALALLAQVRDIAEPAYVARYRNYCGVLAQEAQELDEAEKQFQAAVDAAPGRPVYYSNLCRICRLNGHWREAKASWDKAPPDVQADPNLRAMVGTLLSDAGVERHNVNAFAEAIALYRQALEVDPDSEVIYSNLALAYEAAGDEVAPLAQRLREAIVALEHARALSLVSAAYEARLARLRTRMDALMRYGEQAGASTWVESWLAVEVSAELLPQVRDAATLALTSAMREQVEALRNRLSDRYGIVLPGVRLRESGMPGYSYLIRLGGDAVAFGKLPADLIFSPAPAAALQALGITLVAATNGNVAGHWVRSDQAQRVEGAGLALWPHMEFVMRHFEILLRRELPAFIGCDEVMSLLSDASMRRDPNASVQGLDRVQTCRGGLPGFVAALRRLLAEQVPIGAIAALAQRYAELADAGAPLATVDTALRALPGVRERLPGQTAVRRVEPGSRLAALLHSGVRDSDVLPRLVLPPPDYQIAAEALHGELCGRPNNVLVLDDEGPLRLLVRTMLTAIGLPEQPVLARSELIGSMHIDGIAEVVS